MPDRKEISQLLISVEDAGNGESVADLHLRGNQLELEIAICGLLQSHEEFRNMMFDALINAVAGTKLNPRLVKSESRFIPEENPNNCPACHCIYDDKQQGAQGRNQNCPCTVCNGHQSPK